MLPHDGWEIFTLLSYLPLKALWYPYVWPVMVSKWQGSVTPIHLQAGSKFLIVNFFIWLFAWSWPWPLTWMPYNWQYGQLHAHKTTPPEQSWALTQNWACSNGFRCLTLDFDFDFDSGCRWKYIVNWGDTPLKWVVSIFSMLSRLLSEHWAVWIPISWSLGWSPRDLKKVGA